MPNPVDLVFHGLFSAVDPLGMVLRTLMALLSDALAQVSTDAEILQAAQYYADLPGDPPAPDWPAYDGHTVWTVFGISTHACRIRRLVGVREVEAMPEFAYWVVHPRLGQAVRPTIDVDTIPWQATICSADADLSGVESRLRSMISWNPQVGLGARLAEDIRALVAWVVRHARLLPALTSGRPGRLRANGRQKVRA